MLIVFRLLQGLAGGGLQPMQQAIIMDSFPPEKRGVAFGITGITMIVAPILGPDLGGYITDNFSWRWIFFMNVPVGILAVLAGARACHTIRRMPRPRGLFPSIISGLAFCPSDLARCRSCSIKDRKTTGSPATSSAWSRRLRSPAWSARSCGCCAKRIRWSICVFLRINISVPPAS